MFFEAVCNFGNNQDWSFTCEMLDESAPSLKFKFSGATPGGQEICGVEVFITARRVDGFDARFEELYVADSDDLILTSQLIDRIGTTLSIGGPTDLLGMPPKHVAAMLAAGNFDVLLNIAGTFSEVAVAPARCRVYYK